MTRSEIVVWSVVACALAGVVAIAATVRGSSSQPPADAAVQRGDGVPAGGVDRSDLLPTPAGDIGDVPCVERSGRAMRTSELRGRYVVADFVFTNCGGPCPLMTEKMVKLHEATKAMPDVRLVSFSVDPDRDTPEVLKEYAARVGADPERWLFLRCERPALVDIMCDRLKLVADRNDLLLHSTRFVLFDPAGRARAFSTPLQDEQWLGRLLRDIETLRKESGR